MDFLQQLMGAWQGLQGASQMPDTNQAASLLAQAGDADVFKPLFEGDQAWSPQNFNDLLLDNKTQAQPPQLGMGSPQMGMGAPMLQNNLMPQMVAPQGGMIKGGFGSGNERVTNAQGQAVPGKVMGPQQTPGLTAEQMQKLMQGMPTAQEAKPQFPSAPGLPSNRYTPGNAQLSAGPTGVNRRPTLAELIYGAR